MAKKNRRRPLALAITGLISMIAGITMLAVPVGAHFAAIDDSTTLVCDGDRIVLQWAAVSWMTEEGSGEHPQVIVEMRSDVSDWVTIAVGPFSDANGFRLTGTASVPAGATYVDVRVTPDPSFTWGDGFTGAPTTETRITVPPGLEDCSGVIVPPTPTPTPEEPTPTPEVPTPTPPPAIVPVADVACVEESESDLVRVALTTTSEEPQNVGVFVDGVREGGATISASEPAEVLITQDPGETNTITVRFQGEVIASADVQCVDTIVNPPEEPTPTPEPPTEPTPTPQPPTEPEPTPTPEVRQETELPDTGANSGALSVVAVALLGGGALLMLSGWSLRRRLD